MASFRKFKASMLGDIFVHDNRYAGDGVKHTNENIDEERTYMNYYIKKGSVAEANKRLAELFYVDRKDLVAYPQIIVTLPKDVPSKDERLFFDACYEFYCNDLGEKNIVNAVVHKDEDTPHLHLTFIPVIQKKIAENEFEDIPKHGGTFKKQLKEWCEKKQTDEVEIVCCAKKIDREYLRSMHQRLSSFVTEKIGYETEILNGATANGNKTITELKLATLKKQLEEQEKKNSAIKEEFRAMTLSLKRHGFGVEDIGLIPLVQRIEDLENQNAVYREIISRQRYAFTREEIARLKEKMYEPSRSASVSVFNDYMRSSQIEDNAIILIELPNNTQRMSPQKFMIEEDDDLHRQMKLVQASTNKVMVRSSRTSDRFFVFIKTDDARQTIDCLMELQRHLKEIDFRNRRLYMEKIESDEYNLARSVLEKMGIPTNYYLKHNKGQDDGLQREQAKEK